MYLATPCGKISFSSVYHRRLRRLNQTRNFTGNTNKIVWSTVGCSNNKLMTQQSQDINNIVSLSRASYRYHARCVNEIKNTKKVYLKCNWEKRETIMNIVK